MGDFLPITMKNTFLALRYSIILILLLGLTPEEFFINFHRIFIYHFVRGKLIDV